MTLHAEGTTPGRYLKSIPAIAVAVLVSGWTPSLTAQEEPRLEGRVLDARTGRALANVTVTVIETAAEAKTSRSGEYQLSVGTLGKVGVRLTLRGYATAVEQVTLIAHRTVADFELTPMATLLDELMIRGRSQSGLADDGGVSVGAVDLEDRLGPAAGDALKNIPGVLVSQPSGQVGSGIRIQLRGLRSLLAGTEPLVYVDGVRTSGYNSPLAGFRGQSLLDLIPPSQIDRIEVLKGPAATARYGTGGLAGVILIYTKGRSPTTHW